MNEIWAAVDTASKLVRLLDERTVLRDLLRHHGTMCGDCDKWMKVTCPKEINKNGRQVGPHCNIPRCDQFTLAPSAERIAIEWRANLSAIEGLLKGELHHD